VIGLLALGAVLVLGAAGRSSAKSSGTTREYWIAAVPVVWNIVPNGQDAIEHEHFDPAETTITTVVYKAFTRNWERELRDRRTVSGDNDGIPGPLIKARVGDRIVVHFKNLDNEYNRPHSMHFHGVEYQMGSDGAYIPGFSGPGANVKPGATFTYRLKALPGSVGVWPYHDHSPSMTDSIEGGLYGAMSIIGPKEKRADREFVVYLEQQAGFMTINGRAYVGNTPVLHAKVGDVVQWDVLSLGDDFHTFHVHGHRWFDHGTPRDTQVIGPAESFRVRWKENMPGTWLYHCHVESHMMHGMIGLYRVARR
jgi:FtsP/CotA-like multicopper oxidase with cupredoxin domain